MVHRDAVSERADSLLDTIVACATGAPGAIAVLRLSGPSARRIAAELAPHRTAVTPRQLVRARLRDAKGELLDEALVVEMPAPRSFTGEDMVELHVHGAATVIDAVQAACLELGARAARPGEFSLRALLNGKMDLAQAEALADLIASRSEEQRVVALANLEGGLSKRVAGLLDSLETILAGWSSCLDFPEEIEDESSVLEQDEVLSKISCNIQKMIDSSRVDLSRGLRVVLCGPTNVGKSSLLNAWAGEERVLVDSEPGTTRDPVEVQLVDAGRRWTICDTAGLRETEVELENRGMQLSRDYLRRADLALWLVAPDWVVWPDRASNLRLVGSKGDLAGPTLRRQIEEGAASRGLPFLGWVSVRTGEGLAEVRARLIDPISTSRAAESALAVRERQVEALRRAQRALEGARDQVLTLDLRAQLGREAARALGEILGREVDSELLDRVFSDFCIGK